jgi:hypothetical protein
MDDSLQSRGQAMENAFFKQQDLELVNKLKGELAAKESRDALATASGIENPAVLDALVAAGLSPESLTSVSLIPLVAVAWADNKMEDSEKAAILQAAEVAGIATGSASYEMVQAWLNNKPGDDLVETWKAYIGSLKNSLDESAFGQLKNSVMDRAEKVAESAGGFLGLSTVSAVEKKMLEDLASAF